eukprot:5402293-Amphidinium_carterae.1
MDAKGIGLHAGVAQLAMLSLQPAQCVGAAFHNRSLVSSLRCWHGDPAVNWGTSLQSCSLHHGELDETILSPREDHQCSIHGNGNAQM